MSSNVGQSAPSSRRRIAPVPKPLLPPRGGWYDPSRDGEIAVKGNDLIAIGVPTGPEVGFILGRLAELAAERPEMNEYGALMEMVPGLQGQFRYPPRPRFRITRHAVERYIERVDSSLRYGDAQYEIAVLIENASFARSAPAWTLLNDREKICGGYLEVAEGVCFAVQDGVIRTVLTRELSESEPPGEDPFPNCGKMRSDPHWPDRRYVANSAGEIECRTILNGELVVVSGRSRFIAWKQLRHLFNSRGLRECFEEGQDEYRSHSQLSSETP